MPEFNPEEFALAAERVRDTAAADGRLLVNPADQELGAIVEKEPAVRRTIYGNFVAQSEPMSRAAMFTQNSVDHPFGAKERKLLAQCESAMAGKRLICVDRVVGGQGSKTVVRLIVPEEFAHVAYGGKNLVAPLTHRCDRPDYTRVMFFDEAFEGNKSKPLPQKDITIRLAMLPDGTLLHQIPHFFQVHRSDQHAGYFIISANRLCQVNNRQRIIVQSNIGLIFLSI